MSERSFEIITCAGGRYYDEDGFDRELVETLDANGQRYVLQENDARYLIIEIDDIDDPQLTTFVVEPLFG